MNKEVKHYINVANLYLSLKQKCTIWCIVEDAKPEMEAVCTDLEDMLFKSIIKYIGVAEFLHQKESDEIYALKSKLADSQKLYDSAIAYLSKAIELNPNNKEYYQERGYLYHFGKKNYVAAIEDYKKAIQLEEVEDIEDNWRLGILYKDIGYSYLELNDWVNCFINIAIALKCNNYDYWSYQEFFEEINLKYVHEDENNIHLDAIEIINVLNILIQEESVDIYFLIRGWVYERMDLIEDALEDYTQAIECNINPVFCRKMKKYLEEN